MSSILSPETSGPGRCWSTDEALTNGTMLTANARRHERGRPREGDRVSCRDRKAREARHRFYREVLAITTTR